MCEGLYQNCAIYLYADLKGTFEGAPKDARDWSVFIKKQN